VDHEQAGCVKVFFEIHSGRNKSSIDRDKKNKLGTSKMHNTTLLATETQCTTQNFWEQKPSRIIVVQMDCLHSTTFTHL